MFMTFKNFGYIYDNADLVILTKLYILCKNIAMAQIGA